MGRQRPETLERTRPVKVKAVRADASEGIVEALPSITGNLDLQDDVILPGAITVGLREVPRPKMLFDHDWSKITGKSLDAEELLPKDPRLEEMAPDLSDRGYGALYVVNELNLAKELARDVLSDIVFFDDEGEWSIGYETLDAEFMETEDGRPFRGLKALIVWEDSFVLFGANRLTRTVGAKGVDGAGVKDRLEHLDDAGRRLVLETLSRNLGIDVKAGVYAVSGGKVVRTGERDAPPEPAAGKDADEPKVDDTDGDEAKDGEDEETKLARLPGSIEERQAAIRDAVDAWAAARYPTPATGLRTWAWVFATFVDRVVVQVERPDADDEWWEITYAYEDGDVTLGDAEQIEVVATVRRRDEELSAVRQAIVEDHGQTVTLGAFADLSDEAALGEGVVEYAVAGKRFVREWAVDGHGGVALSNLDGRDPVLSKRARQTVERLGLTVTDGELDAEPEPPAVEPVGDLDLLEQEMAAALAGD